MTTVRHRTGTCTGMYRVAPYSIGYFFVIFLPLFCSVKSQNEYVRTFQWDFELKFDKNKTALICSVLVTFSINTLSLILKKTYQME